MTFYVEAIGLGLLLPGLVSLVAIVAGARLPRAGLLFVGGAGAAAGIGLSAWLLDLVPWRPVESWQWLPLAAVTACIWVAATARYKILKIFDIFFAADVAWLLVPTAARLAPERA